MVRGGDGGGLGTVVATMLFSSMQVDFSVALVVVVVIAKVDSLRCLTLLFVGCVRAADCGWWKLFFVAACDVG
ncbi:hypothetical protein MtrunA17_Chr4g0068641 [Medicago truncatula]|uniref:Transmembrane protein n=1 Tax=Medicago truncatula TaxID=3880 RepID=A0A396IFT8_MEDTR|nr:hypothetical protein MtrunA17_Chr4g0068641 [Medicago truncatula]